MPSAKLARPLLPDIRAVAKLRALDADHCSVEGAAAHTVNEHLNESNRPFG